MTNRRTLDQIANDKRSEISSLWEETNEALRELVEREVIKSGALLVYASTFNFHLDRLIGLPLHDETREDVKKLTRWQVKYHTAEALKDLESAKQFVAEQEI